MREKVINKGNFTYEVTDSNIPVVVDFFAPWCQPCRKMQVVMNQVVDESDGSYAVGTVNVNEEDELSARFKIMSIPTIKIFKGGEVVATSVGVVSKDKIMEMIRSIK